MKKYGIKQADYERMLEAQGGVCAICKKPPKKIHLNVDHDHKTKRIRGLLCPNCNRRLIGRFRNATLFRIAAEYLERLKALGL
jgi:DNA-directed RNA polymerase subunit RPC12/RpoP